MNDNILFCFFSYGRPELTEQGFKSLIPNIRSNDKLLVIDQCYLNSTLFLTQKRIDFLTFTKENYHISPMWMYIESTVLWLKSKNTIYKNEKNDDFNLGWLPEYICIIESDTIGKKGWPERVIKGFDIGLDIGIVSGYNSTEHETIRNEGNFLIKDIVCGVNMIIKREYFLDLMDNILVRKYAMDWKISENNLSNLKFGAVLPGEITHTGPKNLR